MIQHTKNTPAHTPLDENSTSPYYCPMHCEGDKTYDKPSDCPVCGMHLVNQETEKNQKAVRHIRQHLRTVREII